MPFGASIRFQVSQEAGQAAVVRQLDMECSIRPKGDGVAIVLIAIVKHEEFRRGTAFGGLRCSMTVLLHNPGRRNDAGSLGGLIDREPCPDGDEAVAQRERFWVTPRYASRAPSGLAFQKVSTSLSQKVERRQTPALHVAIDGQQPDSFE